MRKALLIAVLLGACGGSEYAWDAKVAGHWRVEFATGCAGPDAAFDIEVDPVVRDGFDGPANELDGAVGDFADADCQWTVRDEGDTAWILCDDGTSALDITLTDGTQQSATVNFWTDGTCTVQDFEATVVERDR